jgi:hypothetical protein
MKREDGGKKNPKSEFPKAQKENQTDHRNR